MARIDWVEQRLLNWGRWCCSRGSGVLGYAGVDLTKLADADAGRDGYITASIPVSDVEASDTHEVVSRLPSELRATIEEYYIGNGTLREKCTRLCVVEDTLHKRIGRAHRLLADHWLARQQLQAEERQRLEQLRRTVKPGGGFYCA